MVQYQNFEESINADVGGYEIVNGYLNSYDRNGNQRNDWNQIAESTMPLKASKFGASFGTKSITAGNDHPMSTDRSGAYNLQASIEQLSKQISRKLIVVNLVSLLINLVLAVIAFYFAFLEDSTSTTAFAADCVLDFISSAIVLWRYYGDLNSVYMHAREQIACIYLGALFEISALAIIVKASSDIVSTGAPVLDDAVVEETSKVFSNKLVILAIVATLACSVLTVFKCALYKTIRDKSILLDVINTLISTVFALSIVMSQVLMNVNPSFWYMDPILSIVLALFMAGFGIKVIHQNFNILKPAASNAANNLGNYFDKSCQTVLDKHPIMYQMSKSAFKGNGNGFKNEKANNYNANLNANVDNTRLNNAANNWQKTNYSTISFV